MAGAVPKTPIQAVAGSGSKIPASREWDGTRTEQKSAFSSWPQAETVRELTKCDLPAHSEHTNNVPVLLKPPNEAPADGTRVSLWENRPKVRDAGMNFQL